MAPSVCETFLNYLPSFKDQGDEPGTISWVPGGQVWIAISQGSLQGRP